MSRGAGRVALLAIAAAVVVSACAGPGTEGDGSVPDLGAVDSIPPVPDLRPEAVELGSDVYRQYCAACHAADLSGQPNWQTRNEDGTYPAPPHDATGHTWHHSDQLLTEIITVGLNVPGSAMPTYGDLLSEEEIDSVIEYLKASWGPDERAFQWQMTWQDRQRGP